MRICTADKATRRRTDDYGYRSCHLEHLASRDREERLEAEAVRQDPVTGWITPQSPFKATDLLRSPSRREAGRVVMGADVKRRRQNPSH